MTLIYKINDLEGKIPYKQWEALKKEFVEFAKEKKQLETNRDEAIEYIKNTYDDVVSSFVKDKPMTNFKARKDLLEILERGKE